MTPFGRRHDVVGRPTFVDRDGGQRLTHGDEWSVR